MVDDAQHINAPARAADKTDGDVTFTKYDRRSLSYASTFDDPFKSRMISIIELFTGKLKILRMIKQFEKRGTPSGQAFWRAALDTMGIDLTTPQEQLNRIPAEGPVVVVANHPHGMVDGMIFADLIGRVRPDYRILTRSLLTSIDEVAGSYMIPVPFPHDPDAQRKGVEMRAKAMAHLKEGGVVALFPSGVVASSDTFFGPAIEQEWNSRAYQIANKISPMLRQSLLLHEIVHSCNKPQGPIVGHPIPQAEIDARADDPRGFMAWLREQTLALKD